MNHRNVNITASILVLCGALGSMGCGNAASVKTTGDAKQASTGDIKEHKVQAKGHDHSGWWCAEHGIPEGVCSQCNAKIAADFQKKGDWCAEHDRAKSQCFLCEPALKEKFAAQYRAKEGKEPPAIEEEHENEAEKKS